MKLPKRKGRNCPRIRKEKDQGERDNRTRKNSGGKMEDARVLYERGRDLKEVKIEKN